MAPRTLGGAARARRAAANMVCCALGESLASHRQAAGFSQADLAAVVGVTQHMVSYWEAGKAAIAAHHLLLVAARLGVPAAALVADGWADAAPCARLLVPAPAGDEVLVRWRRPPRRPLPRAVPSAFHQRSSGTFHPRLTEHLNGTATHPAAGWLVPELERCEVGWRRGNCSAAQTLVAVHGYMKLPIDERREAVAELAANGMSQREIADALGVDPATVNRDLKPVADATPDESEHGSDLPILDDTVADATPNEEPLPEEEMQGILDEAEAVWLRQRAVAGNPSFGSPTLALPHTEAHAASMTTKTTRRQAADRTTTRRRAGIYLRISEDRTGREAGVTRQEKDCVDLCARLGWELVEVFKDNDISAFSGKRRPAYEALKAALTAGRIDAIVCWHADRLYRRSRDLLDLIDLLGETKPEVATVQAGTVDLSTPSGRLVAKIGADVAEHESEHKAERVARWHRARAEAGQPNGGKRPFGYKPDRVTIDKTEAKFIREAAARILAGETQWSVVCDFNARGVPTVTGRPWSTISLGGVLRSPRVAGFREHNGRHYPAVWPAILDRPTWDALRAMNAGRAKPGRPATYPLSTLLYCGGPGDVEVDIGGETLRICNTRLHGSLNGAARGYHCASQSSTNPGCGKVARNAKFLEEYVFEYVLGALDGPGFADALQAQAAADEDSGEHLAALGVLEGRLKRLKHEYGVEDMWSKADFLEQKAELEDRIRDLTAKVTSNGRARAFEGLPPADELRAWWPTAPVERKRQVVGLVVDRIIVLPAGKGGKLFDGKRFDPSRVKFIFAAQP